MYGDGDSIFIDFAGNSNLCLNCHQPRVAPPDAEVAMTYVYSHFGPHHGPQSTILEGIGGYEIAGTVAYPTSQSAHRTSASCVSCHMHEGEHKFEPKVAACTDCHPGAADFDVNGKQTEIAGLMTTLQGKLETAGLLDEGHEVVGTYDTDEAGALYNYFLVFDDRSDGVHNYDYIKALLQNSIEVFP
jgi:hypothetical protein